MLMPNNTAPVKTIKKMTLPKANKTPCDISVAFSLSGEQESSERENGWNPHTHINSV